MKQYMYNIVESWCISEVFEFLDDKQLCRMFKLNAKSRKLLESRFQTIISNRNYDHFRKKIIPKGIDPLNQPLFDAFAHYYYPFQLNLRIVSFYCQNNRTLSLFVQFQNLTFSVLIKRNPILLDDTCSMFVKQNSFNSNNAILYNDQLTHNYSNPHQ